MRKYDYKVLIIHDEYTRELENLLSEGWEIQHITAFAQSVSTGSNFGCVHGDYGAYVILRREK